jgi:hypothetical protein
VSHREVTIAIGAVDQVITALAQSISTNTLRKKQPISFPSIKANLSLGQLLEPTYLTRLLSTLETETVSLGTRGAVLRMEIRRRIWWTLWWSYDSQLHDLHQSPNKETSIIALSVYCSLEALLDRNAIRYNVFLSRFD